MTCLADTDLLVKLAACGLLSHLPLVLGVPLADICIMPTILDELRGNDWKGYPPAVISDALAFAKQLEELHIAPDAEEFGYLTADDDIHPGEAVLFSVTRYLEGFLVVTGDKKSIRALAIAPLCGAVHARLLGHVLCLEQVVLRLIAHLSFPAVEAKIRAGCSCDENLRRAFEDPSTTQASATAVLEESVDRLRKATRNILAP